MLESHANKPASNGALAERLGVTPGSVSAMLTKLDELGLTTHAPYHGVHLTEHGRELALRVIRQHRLVEQFLAEALGMSWDRVDAEAEVLEHVLSDELERLIAARLHDPERDPHGDPIPTAELALSEPATGATLADAPVGVAVRFVRVSDSDPEMLRYLGKRGIAPGAELTVVRREPFGGPVILSRPEGGEQLSFGQELARAMHVEVIAADSAPADGGSASTDCAASARLHPGQRSPHARRKPSGPSRR